MLRKSLIAISLLSLFMVAGAASAQTLVGGDLQIKVEVDKVETVAAFLGAAETDIGTINDGATVIGRVRIDVDAKKVETFSAFNGKACTSIGSVGGCKNQGGGGLF